VETRLDATQIVATSRLVSNITGFPVQPNKAVVGANAFAHASGIHQDGVLKSRQTYEIMRAEDVGWSANRIVLGKLSGRNAFKQRVQELGIPLESDNELQSAFTRFKELADRKAEIFDEDIHALFSDEESAVTTSTFVWFRWRKTRAPAGGPAPKWSFTWARRRSASTPRATARSTRSSRPSKAGSSSGAELQLYSVNAITTGTESQGEVTVRLARGGRIVNGVGADPDIVAASAKAYISALNKLYSTA
jgi:2-isopropylmalate synthase